MSHLALKRAAAAANGADSHLLEALKTRGVSFKTPPDLSSIHPAVFVETPCSISSEVLLSEPLHVGAFTHINGGFIKNVHIGRYCSIARDVQIGHGFHPTNWLSVSPLQYVHEYRGWTQFCSAQHGVLERIETRPFTYDACTYIGHDVWIGNHAIVKDGVSIGNGAIVGAGSIVTRDVPDYAIVVGNPARVLRMRFHERLIERLLATHWWRYSLAGFAGVKFDDVESAVTRIEELIANGLKPYQPSPMTADDFRQLAERLLF